MKVVTLEPTADDVDSILAPGSSSELSHKLASKILRLVSRRLPAFAVPELVTGMALAIDSEKIYPVFSPGYRCWGSRQRPIEILETPMWFEARWYVIFVPLRAVRSSSEDIQALVTPGDNR